LAICGHRATGGIIRWIAPIAIHFAPASFEEDFTGTRKAEDIRPIYIYDLKGPVRLAT
jgi:hypothetical protein